MKKNCLGTYNLLAIAMLILVIGTMAACTKGVSDSRGTGDPDGVPKVSARVTDTEDATRFDILEVNTIPGDGGFDVSVFTKKDSPDLDELFISVDFDATSFYASQIESPTVAGNDSVLHVAQFKDSGIIEAGYVAIKGSEDPAVRAGENILQFKLLPGVAERKVSEAGAAKLGRAKNLQFKKNAEENWILSWDYTNPGDANQDGEVGVTDLTPIGMHYGEKVANSWSDPIRHIDGDSNGEINLGDITPIGMNYSVTLHAYKIQMSEDGNSDFITVGELVLGEQEIQGGDTVRFTYTFGAQYVERAWYRVVAMDNDLNLGPPSEAISEMGRRLDPISVNPGSTVSITVYASDLPAPISHMNSVRLVFPESFEYVQGSANAGCPGGPAYQSDGIWSTFAYTLLFPPDSFFLTVEADREGYSAIDFNVTSLERSLDAAPVGFGDLFNFKLKATGNEPLSLEFVEYSEDGLHRTYFTGPDFVETSFGNSLGMRVQ